MHGNVTPNDHSKRYHPHIGTFAPLGAYLIKQPHETQLGYLKRLTGYEQHVSTCSYNYKTNKSQASAMHALTTYEKS